MKKPNKRFSIKTEARKKRIMSFIKNIWTVRHAFIKLNRVYPEIIMSDEMPLHHNESSEQKTLSFKGASQSMYVKEKTTHFPQRE